MDEYIINPCDKCTIKEGYGGDYRCSCCRYSKLDEINTNLIKKIQKLEVQIEHYKALADRYKEEIKIMKHGLE